jgi:hypothetical protein
MTKPVKSALEKARKALKELLEGVALEKVILVDDQCLELSQTLAKNLPSLSRKAHHEALEAGDARTDYAGWKKGRYKEFMSNDPEALVRERRERIAASPGEVDNEIEVLAYICEEAFHPMLPQAWEALDTDKRKELAETSLVLFDRQLGEGFKSGDVLLGEFLAECDRAYAAILTSVIDPADEIKEALKAAQAQAPGSSSDPARSLISSKQRLMSTAPVDFVEDLRIMCAAPLLVDARNELIVLAQKAHEKAVAELHAIDLRTLEHIAVRAAREEGSWEADALLRVLAIAYRSYAQEQLLAQPMLAKLAKVFEDVRSIFARNAQADAPARAKAGELMRRERYDPGQLINTAGLPLACGDIFQVGEGAEQQGKDLWMLLDQPCDLQLRDTADSRARIASTDLVKLDVGEGPKDRGYDLPSGSQSGPDSQPLHLKMNTRLTVPFEILELCVFDSEGRCRIDTKADQPLIVPQTPALERRWQILIALHKATAAVARSSQDQQVQRRLIGHDGALVGDEQHILAWPIIRTERLNEPYGQLALRAVSEDRSRFAFEPDLTRA